MAYTEPMPTPALNSTNWREAYDSLRQTVLELMAGGVAEQSVGYLNAADPKWGLKKWDPAAPWENDIGPLAAAAHAQKKGVIVPAVYKLKDTTKTGNFDDRNMHVVSVGGGGFIGEGGTILRQIIAPSAGVVVSGFATKSVGASNRHGVNFFDVPQADIPKFAADMAWQIVASGAKKSETSTATSGFFSWSLPGSVVHDLLSSGDTPLAAGKAVMAEAIPILGVTYLISGGSATLAENDVVKGQTSGATMKLEAAGEDLNGSKNMRISTRRVVPGVASNGTVSSFQVGENLLRGTTIVGKIAAAGQVVSKGTTLYDWSKVAVEVTLRKLGGSQGGYTPRPLFPVGDYFSNLISRTENLTFDTIGDPNGVDKVRGAAVDIRGAVYEHHVGDVFKNGYRNGYRIASGFGGTIANSVAEALPNDATTEGGFGYHVEVEGTTQNFSVLGCVSHNVRHGFTTNPTGNSMFLSAADDTLRHGIQRFVSVENHLTFNTYGPGGDTHHGCDSVFFKGCTWTNVLTLGEKDAGGSAGQTRGSNTWFVHCTTIGGRNGFNDATAGFTVPQGNPNPDSTAVWPLTPVHSRTSYLFCRALDYEEVGFRQGLAAESVHHSVIYVGCEMRGKKDSRYKTVGMRLTGVDTWVIDPIFGYNTLAMVDLAPGGYWKDGDPGPKPTKPIPYSIGFIGDTFADYSEAPAGVDLIRVAGHATAGITTLVLPGDVDVVQKKSATTTPSAWVNPISGKTIIRGSGEIRNLTGDTKIPLLKTDAAGYAGVTRKAIPTSSWV
ncbi:hypothetical protein [Rathayibacter sp. Leaf248]|uniref:hypothetical protein n=1 Tax=Rathayibacter sp. Leaf248 TaxID=2876555 RepID=UPI001E4F6748|nr:hypothetical protein [Rathayibacter sp. Leaf248]